MIHGISLRFYIKLSSLVVFIFYIALCGTTQGHRFVLRCGSHPLCENLIIKWPHKLSWFYIFNILSYGFCNPLSSPN